MRVEYHPAVEEELRDIIKYYNQSSTGLGFEFLDEFEKQVLKIASMPSLWLTVQNNVQRSLMTRFPYVIYFRVINDNILRVTIVKHERRHPKLGLKRK
jgi:toxin ParE1/3/4